MTWPGLATRLEGRIVVLEPLAAGHGEGLWAAAEDPEVWQWMIVHADESREVWREWFESALAQSAAGNEAAFAVCARASGEPLGSTRYLSLRPEHRGLEIGYTWLGRAAWNTGANAEAKLLLLEHALETLGCQRVEFKTDARNERARHALEALPAKVEGIFRKHMIVRGGELRDSAWYSVIDDDWPAVRESLGRRVAGKV
ncbi:MAG: GNAT family N-acetyltransferase [Actinobacteria bacterium]|nr:GNAT family N-acetyltransferase [Actinomycetota bacterium]